MAPSWDEARARVLNVEAAVRLLLDAHNAFWGLVNDLAARVTALEHPDNKE